MVIGDVVYEGAGQRPDHLSAGGCCSPATSTAPLEPYLERAAYGARRGGGRRLGHCVGYPGCADAGAFAAYMRAHQIESSLFFAAYGERTVEEVKRSLATRRR